MTDKELKKLSRSELLELLLAQTRGKERLQEELEQTKGQLTERQLKIEKAGDLAHAVLAVNGIMEAAQTAAQQYLDNIQRMEAEVKERCEAMIASAQRDAQMIRNGAFGEMPQETIKGWLNDYENAGTSQL